MKVRKADLVVGKTYWYQRGNYGSGYAAKVGE